MNQLLIALNATAVPLGKDEIRGLSPIGQDALRTGGAEEVTGAFQTQLSNLIGFFTLVGGLFFVVYFLIAGFEWLQSGGDSGKAEKARARMTNGAIGLLIMVLATALVGIVGGVFGIDVLNPAKIFLQIIPQG